MLRSTTVLVMAMLLLVSLTQSSARPEPADPKATQPEEEVEDFDHEQVDERCEGVGEEECLMRRTLVAHIDYIYTKKKLP